MGEICEGIVLKALEIIPSIVEEGDARAIDVIVRCLRHKSQNVRRQALKVLPDFSPYSAGKARLKGMLHIMGCMLEPEINMSGCISDESVRKTAVESLAHIADKNYETGSASITTYFKEQNNRIKLVCSKHLLTPLEVLWYTFLTHEESWERRLYTMDHAGNVQERTGVPLSE